MLPTAERGLREKFLQAASLAGLPALQGALTHNRLAAPHAPPRLPQGKCGVYVFSLSAAYGQTCPAGPNRVLKVGRAGPNSFSRFQYHHYSTTAAGSTLAKSLVSGRILWPYLGIEQLSKDNVRAWLCKNTERDHFMLDAVDAAALTRLELFLRGNLGPVFEGG